MISPVAKIQSKLSNKKKVGHSSPFTTNLRQCNAMNNETLNKNREKSGFLPFKKISRFG